MQRRNFMQRFIGVPMFISALSENNSSMDINSSISSDALPELIFFKNEPNEFAFLTNLGKAHYKFADIGELLAIRSLVDETNPASFVQAYIKFADNCKNIADQSLKSGQLITARDAYARAATYYYATLDYLDAALQQDRFKEIFIIHRKCWKAAAQLMDFNYEEFSIPYEGTTLAGFFMTHKINHAARPLCIFNNGSDGSIVDAWTLGGAGAFERGYNLLTFDGPGQGTSLFEKNLYFRHDWEKVITPVIDSIIHRQEVYKNKIVLLGVSQAGYWVPRAAAFERRIKVIIADPGVTNVSSSWTDHLPAPMLAFLKSGDKNQFNSYLEQGFKQSSLFAAIYNFRARPYGKNNPFDVYSEVQKYNLDGIAEKISCDVIVPSPENESFWPGQSQSLYDMIKSRKQLIKFTAAEGANYHCEPKARLVWEQKVFDCLNEMMKD